jgi:acyl-ACP thioesterase
MAGITRYSREFIVNYCDVNMAGRLSPVSVFRYMEETSCSHTDTWELGMDTLAARGEGWVMHSWYLVMNRYPVRGSAVTVTSWPFGFHHFRAIREFLITDGCGEIGRASSLWIYVNLRKNRPMRIPDDLQSHYTREGERSLDYNFSSLPQVGDASSQQSFTAGLFQIDTNRHVNNIHYIEWMLGGVKPDFYEKHRLRSLEVVYNSPAFFGDRLVSTSGYPLSESEDSQILHQVCPENGGKPLAQARSLWLPCDA